MNEKTDDPKDTAEPEPAKRGRPAGKASKPKRENYADQLKELRTRVGFAVSILRKCDQDDEESGIIAANKQLIEIAIETLEQE